MPALAPNEKLVPQDQYLPTPGIPPSSSVINAMGGPNAVLNSLVTNDSINQLEWERSHQPFRDPHTGRVFIYVPDKRPQRWTTNDSRGGERRQSNRAIEVNEARAMGYDVPLVTNASTLTKQQWEELLTKVVLAARQRLRAVDDLSAASSIGGVSPWQRTNLEYQATSDPGEAVVDMDARTDARTDTPLNILRSVPLPFTHSDFGYSSRELGISRSGPIPMPLDVAMAERASRRVAEVWEDQLIGTITGITYANQTLGAGAYTGTATVYGYLTFPQVLTKHNFTAPTAGGWTPDTTHNEILAALDQLYANRFYGPWILYHSIDATQYLNRVYALAGVISGETLRTVILKNPDIADVRRLDRLTNTFTLIFVQMTNEVAAMVNGQDITVIQWQERGGLELRAKCLGCKVPLLRSDYYNRTGILVGTTT